MRIGFITYATHHLKSEQVLLRWSLLVPPEMISRSRLFLLPFRSRPPRETFFQHRPDQHEGAHPQEVARSIGMPTARCAGPEEIGAGYDAYIVLGAGLLPGEFVEKHVVINAHPGLIPYVRGLDSFKWAVFNRIQVGVTLHRLSREVDMGSVWKRVSTPVFETDSLASFARRHYDLEIAMLSAFHHFFAMEPGPVEALEASSPTRRMPVPLERELEERFEAYKRRYQLSSESDG